MVIRIARTQGLVGELCTGGQIQEAAAEIHRRTQAGGQGVHGRVGAVFDLQCGVSGCVQVCHTDGRAKCSPRACHATTCISEPSCSTGPEDFTDIRVRNKLPCLETLSRLAGTTRISVAHSRVAKMCKGNRCSVSQLNNASRQGPETREVPNTRSFRGLCATAKDSMAHEHPPGNAP